MTARLVRTLSMLSAVLGSLSCSAAPESRRAVSSDAAAPVSSEAAAPASSDSAAAASSDPAYRREAERIRDALEAAGDEHDPLDGAVEVVLVGGARVRWNGDTMPLEDFLLGLRRIARQRIRSGRELPPVAVAMDPDTAFDADGKPTVDQDVVPRISDEVGRLGFPELALGAVDRDLP